MNPDKAIAEMKKSIEDGNIEGAYQILESLQGLEIHNSDYFNVKAILLLATGQSEEAKSTLTEGISRFPDCADLYYNLGFIHFESEHYVESALFFAACCRYVIQDKDAVIREVEMLMKQNSKLYVVFNAFRSAKGEDLVLIAENSFRDETVLKWMARLMKGWGNRVFFVAEPVSVRVPARPELSEVLAIIIDNAEEREGLLHLRPVVLQCGTEVIETTPYIIQHIADKLSPVQHCHVICLSGMLDTIEAADTIQGTGNRFETVFAPTDHRVSDVLSFSFFGDFYRTLNKLYGVNISRDQGQPAVPISIVIPTRNSANTLKYTLQTCLHDQGNDFEIVISDNSTPENNETLNLVQSLKDDRIKYYRPERELTLKENFEFAYCQANGEFIFSLGSDDALLQSGLKTLRYVLEQFPEEDVFLWDRLFYCWPNTSKSQEDQMVIPNPSYRTETIQASYMNSGEFLQAVINLTVSMYALPLCYINSGFRRRYLDTIISKTGKFLDGHSQDIYMGLINCALNDRILHIKHPITIAGMSLQSVGIQGTKVLKSSDELMVYKKKNRSIATEYMREYDTKVFPLIGYSDKWLLFSQFAKICQKKISPKFKLDILDWKLTYSSCVESLSGNDPSFQERVREYEMSSMAVGDESFKQWFKERYMQNANFKGAIYNDPSVKQYKQGIQEDGSLILDASLFGAQNVYDACELSNKLYRI